MDALVVDTCVFSYIHKNDSRAQLYRSHLQGRALALSFMTVAELYRWTVERNWGGKKVEDLRSKLRQYIIVPYDDALAWEWARLRNVKGFHVSVDDAWIAATALRHNVPLVTHNRKNFEKIAGLKLICEDKS